MNGTDTPWMNEPIAWTGQAQDNASQHDPRCCLEEENFRRQRAAVLADAWDEAHAGASRAQPLEQSRGSFEFNFDR